MQKKKHSLKYIDNTKYFINDHYRNDTKLQNIKTNFNNNKCWCELTWVHY